MCVTNAAEEALIASAKGGDQGAFEELWGRHHPNIYTHLKSRLGDAATARELTRLTRPLVWCALPGFDSGRESFSCFATRWTHNCAAQYERVLIYLAKAGDAHAYERLWAIYAQRIVEYFFRRVGNDLSAEELTEATREEVWRKLPSYDERKGSFYTFISIWARYRLMQNHRTTPPDDTNAEEPEDPGIALESLLLLHDLAVKRFPVFLEFLALTFSLDSNPLQLVIYLASQLLGYKPCAIEERFANAKLADMLDTLLDELCDELEDWGIDPDRLSAVRGYFEPLKKSMEQTWGRALGLRAMAAHPRLAHRVIAQTRLRETPLWVGDPGQNISHAWLTIRRRVQSEIKKRGCGPLYEWFREARAQRGREKRVSATRRAEANPGHAEDQSA